MLIGNYSVNLSQGRRLAIPNQLRKSLGTKIIIAKWYENCLVIVPQNNWEQLIKKITGEVTNLTKSVRNTERFVLGSAFELELDKQGRFVLPESLAKFAKIKGNSTFLGLGNRVEIWDTDIWLKKEKVISDKAADLVERIAKNE